MLVLIRGAGDLASGAALRLHRANFPVVMTDLPQPTAIRRTVCFSQAIRFGKTTVEDAVGVCARKRAFSCRRFQISILRATRLPASAGA